MTDIELGVRELIIADICSSYLIKLCVSWGGGTGWVAIFLKYRRKNRLPGYRWHTHKPAILVLDSPFLLDMIIATLKAVHRVLKPQKWFHSTFYSPNLFN